MTAFAHRVFRWRVIGSRLRDEDELLFVGIELQEERASRARRRQNVREQKRRCRGKIGRLGERGQQREMTPFSLRRRESRRASQLDRHSDGDQSAFSSFNLIFTKLYGGHGPEYLKLNTSSYFRLVSFTRSSNACSCARSTKNAAFTIIRSPIGLLLRLATATGFNASWMSATYRALMSSNAESTSRPNCIRAKYVDVVVCRLISSFNRRISSFSRSMLLITFSRSHNTLSPNSILSCILSNTSENA